MEILPMPPLEAMVLRDNGPLGWSAHILSRENPTNVEWRYEVFGPMREEEYESADLERSCQGSSLGHAACAYPATVRCPTCSNWFCDAHAEDELWHPCMLPLGDGGSEK